MPQGQDPFIFPKPPPHFSQMKIAREWVEDKATQGLAQCQPKESQISPKIGNQDWQEKETGDFRELMPKTLLRIK